MIYAAVLETKGYVVGASNAPSGVHRYVAGEGWHHLGWKNVRAFGLAVDPTAPNVLYLAAGNGVLRSQDAGETWRVTTDWTITEVLDVVLDPFDPVGLYIATAYGVWTSPDRAETWQACNEGLNSPNATFTQTLAADVTRPGRFLIGTEAGLFETTDHAAHWHPVGPRAIPIRQVQQCRADPRLWVAGTDGHGLLRSTDGGQSWHRITGPLETETLYAVALHPRRSARLAVAGYQTGVWMTNDGGATWTRSATDLPELTLKALLWQGDRLWAGTVTAGIYYTDDEGATWQDAGLPEAFVSALVALPASTF